MEMSLKPSFRSCLAIAAITAITVTGCGESTKSGDAAQSGDQTAMQQAVSQANNVGKTASSAIDDVTITTKVKAAIIAEPALSTLDIKVHTIDGVVTLEGTIDSAQKLMRAEQLAQTVDGVKTVHNDLVVKATS